MKNDIFLSHASADKVLYIYPIAEILQENYISYWLDEAQIGWGDNIAMKINEGLRLSRFVLLCLSKNFLGRSWPENELAAILTIQNSCGVKRVLPLILNSKQEVLERYPLIQGLSYREYDRDIETLVKELKVQIANSTLSELITQNVIDADLSGQLVEIAQKSGMQSRTIKAVNNLLDQRADPTERYWLYIVLGKIGGVHAEEIIKTGFNEENEFSRRGALKAYDLLKDHHK